MSNNISRNGHRERTKKQYHDFGIESLQDHVILELILFYAIPRRDVKDIAYNLLNHFDNELGAVFNADYDELLKVDGIGENAATLIRLFSDVGNVIKLRRNDRIEKINNWMIAKDFAENELSHLNTERVILLTLNNSMELIKCHAISDGTVNAAKIEIRKIVEHSVRDNAASVIIAHNHPDGSCHPSQEDLKFTYSLKSILKELGIPLNDHIIVGSDGSLSLTNDSRYRNYFE